MPDDRLFHVRLLQSEKVEKLTDFERNVWFVCRLACDDFGVMRFSPNTLQEAARFLEKKSRKVLERAFEQVRAVDLVRTFEHEGRTYCYQWDWQDWQKVDYPRSTLNPKPPPEAAAGCTILTQRLFEQHPGGWRGKKPKDSGTPSEVSPKPSATPSEVPPKVSATPTPKPLAVSRQPVAISPKPLAVVPAAADARSNHPAYRNGRFVVFDWQLEDLRQSLGVHFEEFLWDEWFERLARRLDAEKLAIDKRDLSAWIYAETMTEARRRGIQLATPASKSASDGITAETLAAGLREARERGDFNARR